MNAETLINELTRAAAQSARSNLSNVEPLINDIRRLQEIRPELNEHLARVRDLYTEQVTLTNRVIEALKNEQHGSTQSISSILESNSNPSPSSRRRPSRNNDNPITSLLSMFADFPMNTSTYSTYSTIPNTRLLTTEDLAQFTLIEYSDIDDKDGNCSVCQDTFSEDKGPYRKLPCNHLFHTNCIDRWLTAQDTHCPTCRADVRT